VSVINISFSLAHLSFKTCCRQVASSLKVHTRDPGSLQHMASSGSMVVGRAQGSQQRDVTGLAGKGAHRAGLLTSDLDSIPGAQSCKGAECYHLQVCPEEGEMPPDSFYHILNFAFTKFHSFSHKGNTVPSPQGAQAQVTCSSYF
jgi:hypothetical protein